MSIKQNCWEYKQCGREPSGKNIKECGMCPATTHVSSDGLNGGTNGGRICWAIAGTFCGDKVQGTFAEKEPTCMSCDFYKMVKEEEGVIGFILLMPGQKYRPIK